jgi:hypothetical protein
MLIAQAAIDKEYAGKLEALAGAFCPDPSDGYLIRPERVNSGEDGNFLGECSSAPQQPLSDEQAVLMGADRLLSCVSEANATSSLLWKDFSAMIGESMIQGKSDPTAATHSGFM